MTSETATIALMAEIETVRLVLQQYLDRSSGKSSPSVEPPAKPAASALDILVDRFQLTPFERNILLLCVAAELDWQILRLCAETQQNARLTYPSFSLAFALFPELKHWSATKPTSPLRYWDLIRIHPETTLMSDSLRVNEWVVHYLMGEPYLALDLLGVVGELPDETATSPRPTSQLPTSQLPTSQQTLVDRLVRLWQSEAEPAIVQLCGDGVTGRSIAQQACRRLGYPLYRLSPQFLPVAPDLLDRALRLWERQAKLTEGALLLEYDEATLARDSTKHNAVVYWLDTVRSPLVVTTHARLQERYRPLVTFTVPKLSLGEQRQVWQHAIVRTWDSLDRSAMDSGIDRLVSQFDLSVPGIEAACQAALSQCGRSIENEVQIFEALWESCRALARPRMGNLAQPIEASATWEDLVLPDVAKQILREIVAHVRQRSIVYERWGFAEKSRRGLGVSALFSGPSGTGKTMAAEVLARELHLDLYRIDLSAVVSKYIGETEENLRKVFDAAEASGAILLFDEADALFGKRSEIRDSHDRYANIEVSYLLQRMEDYQGLAILTTNLKDALDSAFLRRLRFVVQFPFPDAQQRRHIWRNTFPEALPMSIDGEKDLRKLARLNVAGGNIRSVALNAAFLAAEGEERMLTMRHLLRAAQLEALKLERPLTDGEIRGWIPEDEGF
ncbi:MAG: ATP-binding protein [Cyanobacteria bacterium SBC]|nr:ATP-binding protein [Cyanobacteria bacterium SBC]